MAEIQIDYALDALTLTNELNRQALHSDPKGTVFTAGEEAVN